jgi:hypothetical protein
MNANTEIQDELKLRISFNAQNYLLTAARWAKFLGVIGFIFSSLLVIVGFSMGSLLSLIPQQEGMPLTGAFTGVGFLFIYLLLGGLYFLISYFLYSFGSKTKHALTIQDEGVLEDGMKFLKKHLATIGVLTIVMLSIYALALIGGIIAAIAMGFGG